MTDSAMDARAAFEGAIRARAATDPAFRAQLSEQPIQAIKAAFGFDMPSELKLQIVTEKPGEMVVVLPSPSGELLEDELDAVSGGFSLNHLLTLIKPIAGSVVLKKNLP
ncbi:NHLP leader peptide family RiPP precursor [Rhizobium sp. SSA_523]|uniref:NHLP leader peptide family RiPP precursor n=1 Tax=Rhizobium sp. SSA_523 TaxID=2952477 RepID=UPI00209045AE|nr:NHLP leader peptide family RiPP precursor [Rhizobium sp. SSA_523]MCO5734807.1 NHLP leader peptide family RiPP precursor [Rhizobium sp. SSA_523]WKC21054.1 NHLP leader peptide family RiPP precursor [Rhizobium sp. SSA_523]